MYALIDFANHENELQPIQHVHSCEFSISLEKLKSKLNQLVTNHESYDLSNYESDEITLHNLVIIEIKENTSVRFNDMMCSFVFSDATIVEATYKSCDC